MTLTKAKIRKVIWQVADILLAVLPLVIFIITRWNKYLGVTNKNTLTNIIGFVFLMFFLCCILMKKTELLKGIVGFWVVTVILYCFRHIINDICPIALWSSVGMTASKFITNPFVEKWKRLVLSYENAEVQNVYNESNTNLIVEAIKSLNGRG